MLNMFCDLHPAAGLSQDRLSYELGLEQYMSSSLQSPAAIWVKSGLRDTHSELLLITELL